MEDLNSTNGTFVNSKIVKKHALKDGDLIDIGNHRIKYVNHLATNSANSNFEKTVVMSPESSQDKIDASIADLVDQIDAIAAAGYVSKPQSINELEDIEEVLLSEESEEYSNSLETLANSESSDDVESIAPSESTDNIETLDSTAGMDEDHSELSKETEFNGADETLASAEKSDPIETAINSDVPEHVGTYDPAETMDEIKEMKSIDTVDPVETRDDLELPNQLESIDVDQTSTLAIEDDSQSDATGNNLGQIQILNGSNTGKELVLDKSLTTIGKPGVAVIGITKRSSGYYIIQTEGNKNNPAKLNNELIEGKAQKLEAHDIIDVADIKLEYYIN